MVSIWARHAATHGGICCCGDHLGVMVGTDISRVPPGWAFIPLADATPEIVQDTIDEVRKGRAQWPEKETSC